MERITARTNDKIKYASLLASSASKRRESGEFLLEGARLCADAAACSVEIVRSFFTSDALEKYSSYISVITDACRECYEITPEVASRLSDTGSSQGVFCVCRMRECSYALKSTDRCIALENLQDPSNVGAVIRSAEAIGIDALIVSGGCDIYNPKVLRAAMGSAMRMNIIQCDSLPAFIEKSKAGGFVSFACVVSGEAEDIRNTGALAGEKGIICCIGNEGNGLTQETVNACDYRVTIPMQGKAESLNAAAAASIAAWELKR